MAELKHTKVHRGGVTARGYSYETNVCSFDAIKARRSLGFRFRLASKGGGTTEVYLEIGYEDFQSIFEAIATNMPESAELLSNCAAIAMRRNPEMLKEIEGRKNYLTSTAEEMMEKLEAVKEFVYKQHLQDVQ